jgi:hypothetical protein
MVIDVKRIRRRLVFSPPHAVSFSNDDVTANTHRRDAEGTANPKNGMHGAACVCVTCYGVRLCERCALVVTYPFCSGLNDDFTANMHRQDAEGAETSISTLCLLRRCAVHAARSNSSSRNWRRCNSAYNPPRASSSSCVPRSTIRP